MPGTPTVELTDTNETITLAQGIRRKQITLTAHRTKTLSKSGASEEERSYKQILGVTLLNGKLVFM